MLQPTHDHAISRILWDLKALFLLQALDVDQCAHKLSVQRALVCKALNVLGCVRVDMLERAGELIIEPLDERHNAAGDLEKLTLLDGRCLLIVLPLLSALDDNDFVAVLEDLEKLAKLLVGPRKGQRMCCLPQCQRDLQLPLLLMHVACGTGSQVEASRDKCQKNADSLVVVDRDIEQLLHGADLLELVCVLASTLLDNRSQLLEDTLCSVLDGLAAGSNSNETIVASVNDGLSAELRNPALVLLLLLLGRLLDDLDLFHELLLVLPVQVDVPLVVAVVLLDLLADGVETTLVDGVHLLGGDLLLLVGLENGSLEVGDGLNVHFGDLAIVLLDQGGDQAVELVELCMSAPLALFVIPRHHILQQRMLAASSIFPRGARTV